MEKDANIKRLRHFSEEEKIPILHPERNKIKIIRMPFIGLFPWISDIIKGLMGEDIEKKEIKELLEANNLIENNKPTDMGKRFRQILGKVESLPGPCTEQKYLKPDEVPHHNRNEITTVAKKILDRYNFICEIKPIPWKEGQPNVKIKDNHVEIYFRHRKGFTIGLSVITTANTKGQLEAVKNELERFNRYV